MYLILLIILSSCTKDLFLKQYNTKTLKPRLDVKDRKLFSGNLIIDKIIDFNNKNKETIDKIKEGELKDIYRKKFPFHFYIYSNKSLEDFKKLFEYFNRLKSKIVSHEFDNYINGRDDEGFAPIHLIILFRRSDILKELVSKKELLNPNLNQITLNEYLHPLSLAINNLVANEESEDELFKYKEIIDLLKDLYSPKDLNNLDRENISPCGYAALNGNIELVKYLIEEKNYSISNEEIHPLMLAVLNNHYAVVEYLFSKKYHESWDNNKKLEFVNYMFTNSDIESLKKNLNEEFKKVVDEYIEDYSTKQNDRGVTPLVYTLKNKNEANVKEVITNFDNKIKSSQIIFSICESDEAEALEELIKIQKSSAENINFEGIFNENLETPLHVALKNKSYKVASLLIKEMNNFGHVNKNGLTYFHLIVEKASSGTFDELLNRCKFLKIDIKNLINKKNKAQNTPLHIAARKGLTNIVKKLLENGANINEVNEDKKTALHNAVKNQREAIVEELLNSNTSCNIQDAKGFTPLHYAVLNENARIVKMLMDRGADPSIRDNEEKLPEDFTYNPLIIKELNLKNDLSNKEIIIRVHGNKELENVIELLKGKDISVKLENLNSDPEGANKKFPVPVSVVEEVMKEANNNSNVRPKASKERTEVEIKQYSDIEVPKEHEKSTKELRDLVDNILSNLDSKGQNDIEKIKNEIIEKSKFSYKLEDKDKENIEKAISKISSNIEDLSQADEDNLKAAGIDDLKVVIEDLKSISDELKTVASQ